MHINVTGLSHEAINSLMLKKEHTRSMRDNQKVILGRPRSETGRQTFKHHAAIIIWNALPEGVKCSPNYNSFKFALKKQSNLVDNMALVQIRTPLRALVGFLVRISRVFS